MRLIMPQLTRPPARTHPSAPENETFIRITNLVYFTVEPINSSVCVCGYFSAFCSVRTILISRNRCNSIFRWNFMLIPLFSCHNADRLNLLFVWTWKKGTQDFRLFPDNNLYSAHCTQYKYFNCLLSLFSRIT